MMKLAILFALVGIAAAGRLGLMNPLSPTGRIVGGQATTIEQLPYSVVFSIANTWRCGGSIISSEWVLTAAHCMDYPTSWFQIRAGSTFASSGGSLHGASAVISHADYYEDEFYVPHDDIGVVRVNTAFAFGSTRAPIALFNAGEESVPGTNAITSGWGTTSEGGFVAETLQSVTVPIIAQSTCNILYSSIGGIPARQICAGYLLGGQDACGGDSGGPLAIGGRLAGVVSWGGGCARPGNPGVYAEVASYRSWITQHSGV